MTEFKNTLNVQFDYFIKIKECEKFEITVIYATSVQS